MKVAALFNSKYLQKADTKFSIHFPNGISFLELKGFAKVKKVSYLASHKIPKNLLPPDLLGPYAPSDPFPNGSLPLEITGKEVERLARKFRLDDPVASRFTELIHRRKKDGEIDRMHKENGSSRAVEGMDKMVVNCSEEMFQVEN